MGRASSPGPAFDVVAVIASAGGHAAIRILLEGLPAGFPLPILIMQHLGSMSDSTVNLYRRSLPFDAEWVHSGSHLEPAKVLVCPYRTLVELLPDGTFRISPNESGIQNRPFDVLLESVAQSFGTRAIAVVLTGMGDDGARGARRVRQAGGCVLVQSEASAEHPSMVRAAIKAGAATVVLPLESMAEALIDMAEGGPAPRQPTELEAVEALFGGDGRARAEMRAVDWSRTPLGPVLEWPQALRNMVRNALATSFPTCIHWGPELTQIYNDAFLPIFGSKPSPAGKPTRQTWPELWEEVGRAMDTVMRTGTCIHAVDHLFNPDRHGFVEEAYFTFSYSPLHDMDGRIVGVQTVALETTAQVFGVRRLKVLRNLATLEAGDAPLPVIERAARVLADAPLDVPFALFYLLDRRRTRADLAAALGLVAGAPGAPHSVAFEGPSAWPLEEAARTGKAITVDDVPTRVAGRHCGPWPESPRSAMVLPLRAGGDGPILGILVAGMSPRILHEPSYADFLSLLARETSSRLGEAVTREQERERIESLQELDRAKVEFFSNVSHEFRTPLTLLLGPLEELLRRREALPADLEAGVEAAARNGRRLLDLVNTLLDFSRTGSRPEPADFEPTDLGALTADIVSAFRSAVESAGLSLNLDIHPDLPPVWIDRGIWEKIVSNLLSNAFKFTFEGGIMVELRPLGLHAELIVRDTGVGIPENELPHVFMRFHRVRGTRARSAEGAGIGLSMVEDLAKRISGQVRVMSREGRGTEFTVWVPYKSPRIPPAALHREGVREPLEETAFALERAREASRWLADAGPSPSPQGVLEDLVGPVPVDPLPAAQGGRQGRLLVVDDNADMRAYLARLLGGRWEVETAAGGAAALETARRAAPDAILADVMMPGMDGFELLRRVREDGRLRHVPVMLVTARAGEDAAIEGLLAGADDYVAKPFSPRELMARVWTVVERARAEAALRKSERAVRISEQQLRLGAQAAGMFQWEIDLTNGKVRLSANAGELMGMPLAQSEEVWANLRRYQENFPEEFAAYLEARERFLRGEGDFHQEVRILPPGSEEPMWLEVHGTLLTDAKGAPLRAVGVCRNVTARKSAEEELRSSERRQAFLLRFSDALRPLQDPVALQREAERMLGEHLRATRAHYIDVDADADRLSVQGEYRSEGARPQLGTWRSGEFPGIYDRLLRGETVVQCDLTDVHPAARARIEANGSAAFVAMPLVKDGRVAGLFAVNQDRPRAWTAEEVALIEEVAERTWAAVVRARAEEALRASEAKYRALSETVGDGAGRVPGKHLGTPPFI